ncbi:MAG: hypothetical protein KJ556_21550 [Gammaproteobacteria bacterium]|nr:hypothetical protein [Gammaproteobacteria bacterium]
MEKAIELLSNPQVLAALLGFASGALVIVVALLRKFNVISQDDVDFALETVRKAKVGAGDIFDAVGEVKESAKPIISAITDGTRMTDTAAAAVVKELLTTYPDDNPRKQACRVFRKLRKGILGI